MKLLLGLVMAVLTVLLVNIAINTVVDAMDDAARQKARAEAWHYEQNLLLDMEKRRAMATAEAERLQRDLVAERQRAELAAATRPVVHFGLVYGALLALAAITVAMGIGFWSWGRRRADLVWPDSSGRLPVRFVDLPAVAPVALADYHQAKLAAASVQPVPVHYAPHVTYAKPDSRTTIESTTVPPALPGPVDLADISHLPTKRSILLGLAEGGHPITVPAAALCHVALVGATGGGKSNLLRLLLPQLQATGANVVLADPHHTAVDPETGEDWRLIAARLHMQPAVRPDEIDSLLDYLTTELAQRLELRRRGEKWGAPLFFAFDELPVIVDTVQNAMERLTSVLREGRKVHIYSVGASQTMLVKALGGDATVRDAYRTSYYVGGDQVSAAKLLDLPQRQIDDGQLSTGLAYLRAATAAPARVVRIPLASNRAVDSFLSPSPAPSDAPSPAPSENRPFGFQPASLEGAGEGAKGFPLPAHSSAAKLTPEEAHIVASFLAGKSPSEIAEGLAGSRGGSAYQRAAAKVAAAIRKALGGE
jgi:hypothetical protein